MSAPPRYFDRKNGMIIDLFAGGGGASTGLEAALERPVSVAVNHWSTAIDVHTANHPATKHFCASVWEVKPREVTKGRKVDVLWASPDCTHFSVAKGGKPRQQNIRSLAEVVVEWAQAVMPRLIFVENVREFLTWGPLDADGYPIKARAGELFTRWRGRLELLGYTVDWKVLNAADFGAPTSRKRLFVVARRDGKPVTWPTPTHGPGRALPYRTAAECIDWSIPCPSIFERERPLADKTLRRIAAGIRRFVIETSDPFIIPVNHGGGEDRAHSSREPLLTVTAARRSHALVTPFVAGIDHQSSASAEHSVEAPISTITSKARHVLVSPFVAGVGGRAGESLPTAGDAPVGTITAKNDRVVVTPFMTKLRGDSTGQRVDQPAPTITAGGKAKRTSTGNVLGIAAPTLVQTGYGEREGQRPRYLDLHQPLGTLMAQGQKHGLVTSFLAKHYGGVVGVPFDGRPLDTVTAQDHHSLVAASLATFRGTGPGQPMAADVRSPLGTISAGGIHAAPVMAHLNGRVDHRDEVRAFLAAYYGTDPGQSLNDPMRTVVTKDRFGLVMVGGVEHVITDIGMRMLEPHELLRAQFGQFADGYDLSAAKTKAAKVRLIGNSVAPECAAAVIKANHGAAA